MLQPERMRVEQTTAHRWPTSGLVLALSSAALWGLAPVATKGALAGFSPELIGVLRLALAALLFWLLSPRGPLFVWDPWLWLAGLALGVDFILYNYGLQRTSASISGLVINVEVVSTVGFAMWLLGERLTVRRVIGCLVTLGGVGIVTVDGLHLSAWFADARMVGNLMVMAAGVSWSLFAIAQRRADTATDLCGRLATTFAVAAATLVPTLLHADAWRVTGGLGPSINVVVLTLFCTGLVYFLYGRAQQLIDVSVLAILISSIPVFAVLFAALVLGEPLTERLVAGGGFVVAGILIIAAERHAGLRPSHRRG